MTETRERFLSVATELFAERGFYGTSIAAIADALPYTKQALLHHFGSKEKLYGEVIRRISERLVHEMRAVGDAKTTREQFEKSLIGFLESAFRHPADSQLLMRELLDNRRRAKAAKSWYLKPFLESLTDMLLRVPGTDIRNRTTALAAVYQLLGAISYFVVSQPTLERMYGRKEFTALQANYAMELRKLIAARLD